MGTCFDDEHGEIMKMVKALSQNSIYPTTLRKTEIEVVII
jgi:hypothetical protein